MNNGNKLPGMPGSIEQIFDIANVLIERYQERPTSGPLLSTTDALRIAADIRRNDLLEGQVEVMRSMMEAFEDVCSHVFAVLAKAEILTIKKEGGRPTTDNSPVSRRHGY